MLLVNYWDSTIGTLELLPDGRLGPLMSTYDPKGAKNTLHLTLPSYS